MKRGTYVRMEVFRIPGGLKAPLSMLVIISERVSRIEGWLTGHVEVGGRVYLTARVKDGELVLGFYTSAPILAIEGQHVRTSKLLYEIVKIPPSRRGDTFTEFA